MARRRAHRNPLALPEDILIGMDELGEHGFEIDKVLARAKDATEGQQYEILRDWLYEWDAERPVDADDPDVKRADALVARVLREVEETWDKARKARPQTVPMRVAWVTRPRSVAHKDGRGLVGRDWDDREVDLYCPGGTAYQERQDPEGTNWWRGFCRNCGKYTDVEVDRPMEGTRVHFAPGYYHEVDNRDLDVSGLWGTVVEAERNHAIITLDKHFNILDEWDNELIFTPDTFPDMASGPERDIWPYLMQLFDTVRPPGS